VCETDHGLLRRPGQQPVPRLGRPDPPGRTNAEEADFNRQNIALAAELNRVSAKHLTTHFYGPGTHAWAYWQRKLHASLPMLLGALGVEG
jgi:S-formylglutathione hydrolase FrmB